MTMRVETNPWAPYAVLLEHDLDGAGEALCTPVNEWEHLKPALCAEGAITDGCLRLVIEKTRLNIDSEVVATGGLEPPTSAL